MKPDLKNEIENILETYHNYYDDEVNEKAHNAIVAEDIIRVVKQHLITIIK